MVTMANIRMLVIIKVYLQFHIDVLRHPSHIRVDPLHQHGPIAHVAGGQLVRQLEQDLLVVITEG